MNTKKDKKQLISRFLERCNRYADDKLVGYHAALAETEGPEALALTDKISHWTAYRSFNEYAINELATDRLDDWLDD